MNLPLDLLLGIVALGILLWGFERYRSRFSKSELLIAIAAAIGLFAIAFVPTVYDWVGNVLNIRRRYVTISLLANIGLIGCVLYLVSLIRNTRTRVNDLTRSLSVDQADAAIADGGEDILSIVIPAYNEEETIRDVVSSLPEKVRGHLVQPIVVSDGSADDTAIRAREDGVVVVEHPLNQGQGGALQTGFEIAMKQGASIVVTMDGDGQHPVGELEALVSPIVDDEADYVMGSRHKGTDRSGNHLLRRAGIRAFTTMINVLTKSSITDCTNGFRAIRGSELDELLLTEERFSAPELIIEARKNGLRLEEIPITIEERQAGETKKPRLGYAIGLTRTILTTWVR
ncbi:glycosyltransferase family 2 protein [Halococcus hamelinensis]|uniref:Family 2 glycosyl transferase n=1 Tax=Halococcus hamelinensis 100A6 TaxID=1132509 RepID=M0LTI7_9EURY|nr:glycosyltransferase family 2 protein [Halococcus hamelinensis]EMA36872.1 family 2 glycosyl transferase [Halococcus hamelinensis 100A6]